jgi:hypothetical protein
MGIRRIGIAACAALAVIAADDGWAARTGSRSGGKSSVGRFSGARAPGAFVVAAPRFSRSAPLTGSPTPFRHHGRAVIFIGAPFYFWSWPYGYSYLPPPYYYGPDYVGRYELPPVYVEKFEGTPTPQTQGDIFCPSANAYYPDVKDCPNGWQRIIREADDIPEDAYAG